MKMTKMEGRWAHACAAAVLSGFLMSGSAALAQGKPAAAPAPQATPAPKILVANVNAIFAASKVGQDIARQVKAYRQSEATEFKGEEEALKREGQALQQQIAILAPSVQKQKQAGFEAKVAAFQKKVRDRDSLIQGGAMQAQQQVENALGPILQGIMAERGANVLLDRRAVVLAAGGLDISQVAADRLNKKLPAVKVNLVAPPPGAQEQQ
ncbi:MAG: OmpH family outer membrane protein [Pseudomonadota bacterium]|nr:OmpH family outer membrane protein [Pseudomonadota bacterium]